MRYRTRNDRSPQGLQRVFFTGYIEIAYSSLGGVCTALGKLNEAQQYYEQSLQIEEQLAEETGTVRAYDDLAVSHYNLSIFSKSVVEKRRHFSEALQIWTQLAEQCPEVKEYAERRDMAKKELEKL